MKKTPWLAAFSGAIALSSVTSLGADYYVSPDGNDAYAGTSANTAFGTIDHAIGVATSAEDVIHVAAGSYSTSTQYGPNLKTKLVGSGASRDDVVIISDGQNRTLRMAANSWLENVTVVGCTDITKADKGGAIEMNGGTITNCVIRDGTAKGNDSKNAGGNLYVNSDAALVVDCVISGGTVNNRGGNVCLDHGTLRKCTVMGGTTSGGSENNGGNVWTYMGKIEDCTITDGSAVLGGNVFIYNANASLTGGTISGGTATQYGGNVYLRQGTISKATISGGSTSTNSGNYGGGNLYADGSAIVSECVILNGSAYRRGGNVYALGGATITDCAITNGVCSANIGGNVYMEAATVTNSTVYGGSAPAGRGGNIFLNNAASLVTDCVIENGNAGTQGGNLYVGAGSVSGSTIANGTSTSNGGNIFMAASTVVSDCVISNGTINSTNSNWDGPKGVNVNLNGASAKLLRCHVIGGTTTPLKEDGTFYYDRGSVAVNNSSAQIDNCLVEGSACGGVVMQSNGFLYSSTVLNNGRYGYWAWNANQHVYNTVIYGNTANDANADWTGDMPNGDSAEFLNNALTESGSRHTTSAYPTVVLLANDSAFADYANGDYRLVVGSALIDAGAVDPRGSAASPTDLAGNTRTSGTIDIGCYEYQKPDMSVHIDSATPNQMFAPMTVMFTHSADNSASPENVVFSYDFGDGVTEENIAGGTISHTYANPGLYTVVITATNECDEEEAEMTYPSYVRVSSSVIYATPGNDAAGAFPYNTPETGFGNLKTAVDTALDGNTLLIGAGVYEISGQISVGKAITIRGTGSTPEAVVIRNTAAIPDGERYRTMTVNNADARVENITLENGCVKNYFGGNLKLSAGVVSNCVIRGGLAVADGNNAAGGGVSIEGSAGTSILTHCVVTNNIVSGTAREDAYAGGAIIFPYGSKGKMYNTLVAFNTFVPSVDDKRGTAGIRFGGGNEQAVVENCTVASNTVNGTITSSSAGAFCNSWSTTIRNTVFAGNYETGTARFTSVNFESHMNVVGCVMDDVAFNQYCTVASVDNIFKNFQNGNFAPLSAGALYNTGYTPSVAVSVDLAGNPRVMFDKIDIGCYECQAQAATLVIFH